MSAQVSAPTDFGYRNFREPINREMRAIIWRHRSTPEFRTVRDRLPADWEAEWIDYVHEYANPGLDAGYLDIYREFADSIESSATARRFPV